MILPTIQKVSSKGQVVIPAKIRKTLGIKAGTELIISADEKEKKITASPAPEDPIKAAKGVLRKYGFNKKILKEMLEEKKKEVEYEDKLP